MSLMKQFNRELRFCLREKSLIVCIGAVFLCTLISLSFGYFEVQRQNTTLAELRQLDAKEREATTGKHGDWGSAAYYTFHLTYLAPSNFAFAAMGRRDLQPWKHRVRMLALEGQIYERDVVNPVVALIGRLDYAFLVAFVLPLIIILLLHDVRGSEQVAGRLALLEATASNAKLFWWLRSVVRAALIFLSAAVPLLCVGFIAQTPLAVLLAACALVFVYVFFWMAVCHAVAGLSERGVSITSAVKGRAFTAENTKGRTSSRRWGSRQSGGAYLPAMPSLMLLLGVWLTTAVIIPAAGRLAIDSAISLPSGADILMTQREAVNDAWDLPKEDTMTVFFDRHPQWSDYVRVGQGFEWPWYYAFQQVGDQKAEALSEAFRLGRLRRESAAGWLAWLTPPTLFERTMQALAGTDASALSAYEDSVREYHAELRDFYYPKLFGHKPYDASLLKQLPEWVGD